MPYSNKILNYTYLNGNNEYTIRKVILIDRYNDILNAIGTFDWVKLSDIPHGAFTRNQTIYMESTVESVHYHIKLIEEENVYPIFVNSTILLIINIGAIIKYAQYK